MSRSRMKRYTSSVSLVLLSVAGTVVFLHGLSAYRPSYIRRPVPEPAIILHSLNGILQAVEDTPILSYDDALEQNQKTCPKSREVQCDINVVNERRNRWLEISTETLRQKRQTIIEAVRERFSLSEPQTRDQQVLQAGMYGHGRGIVYAGGNGDTLLRLRTSLRILRYRHLCQLPVEIFMFPEELEESQNSDLLKELQSLKGVTIRTLHSGPKNYGLWKNFQIKAEAVLASSFAEVLYLDTDNVPLADPAFLFNHEVYKRHGVVFWRDLWKDSPLNPFWRVLGRQCNLDYQLETGQILVDKRGQDGLNLAAFVAASAMQKDYDFWFKLSNGDKDTFRYSFYLLGLSFSTPEHWVSALGFREAAPSNDHTMCGLAMLQYSLSSSDWIHFPSTQPSMVDLTTHAPPLFAHVNLLKLWGNREKRPVFDTLKRFRNDTMDQDTSHFRAGLVWKSGGLGFDIWDAFDEADPREGGNYDNGDVVIEDVNQAFGGLLASFNDIFYTEGGRAGTY